MSDVIQIMSEDIPLKTSLLRSVMTGPDKTLSSKGTKKSKSGKELKGPPFVSKPETVLFKVIVKWHDTTTLSFPLQIITLVTILKLAIMCYINKSTHCFAGF